MAAKYVIIGNGIDRTGVDLPGKSDGTGWQNARLATPGRLSRGVRSRKRGITGKGSGTRVGSRVEASGEQSRRIGRFLVVAALERARANISCTSAYTRGYTRVRALSGSNVNVCVCVCVHTHGRGLYSCYLGARAKALAGSPNIFLLI